MCTTAEVKDVRTADRDIEVFVLRNKIDEGSYLSVFTRYRWVLEHVYETRFGAIEDNGWIIPIETANERDTLIGFHSSKEPYALFESSRIGEWGETVVLGAIIPKGTLYAQGITQRCSDAIDGSEAFVSNKLKLIAEIKKCADISLERVQNMLKADPAETIDNEHVFKP